MFQKFLVELLYCLLQSVHPTASPECKATSSSDTRRLKRKLKSYMETQ